MAKTREKVEAVTDFIWGGGAPKSPPTATAAMKLKDTCSLEESLDKPSQDVKKQRHHFTNKGSYVKAGFFW